MKISGVRLHLWHAINCNVIEYERIIDPRRKAKCRLHRMTPEYGKTFTNSQGGERAMTPEYLKWVFYTYINSINIYIYCFIMTMPLDRLA